MDKTVYGYKEFTEDYESFGIAGYVIYIDGFKCQIKDGNDLTIDYFKLNQPVKPEKNTDTDIYIEHQMKQ